MDALRLHVVVVLFAALGVAGCGDDGSSSTPDAGAADAGVDAYRPPRVDAGPPDAGPRVALCDPAAVPGPFPAPDAWAPNRGPGGPARSFADGELYTQCAYLDGGE